MYMLNVHCAKSLCHLSILCSMCSGCIIRGFNGACLDDGAQGDIPRDALRQASQAADAEEDAEVRALTELEWLKEGERYETRQPRDVTMR